MQNSGPCQRRVDLQMAGILGKNKLHLFCKKRFVESILQTAYQVGQAIRKGRVNQNFSQVWLAQQFNISQSTLSKIEQVLA